MPFSCSDVWWIKTQIDSGATVPGFTSWLMNGGSKLLSFFVSSSVKWSNDRSYLRYKINETINIEHLNYS
jgi:hypothetical protein